MNTTPTHTNFVHRSVNIPYRRRREKFARQPRFNGERISRAGRIEKGITHKPCGGGSSAPSIKAYNVCSRQPEPIRTSDPSGYNTGNVPPSYGPEDCNLFTTKKPSR